MSIELYDLAGADPTIMFSSFSWHVRSALVPENLDFTVMPWRFSDRRATKASGHDRIPEIRDREQWIGDSWEIAFYLDRSYHDRRMRMKDVESQAASLRKLAYGADCRTQFGV